MPTQFTLSSAIHAATIRDVRRESQCLHSVPKRTCSRICTEVQVATQSGPRLLRFSAPSPVGLLSLTTRSVSRCPRLWRVANQRQRSCYPSDSKREPLPPEYFRRVSRILSGIERTGNSYRVLPCDKSTLHTYARSACQKCNCSWWDMSRTLSSNNPKASQVKP